MTALLPPWPLFLAFMAASFILAITPGPGVIYIVTRSATHGRRHGIAFTVVKFAGAAYLIWLGGRMLFARSAPPTPPDAAPASLTRIFRDGLLVAALNPKTTMFFAAFMPQFVGAPEQALVQTLVLGSLFVLIAACTDCLYALAAGWIAPRLSRRGAGLLPRRAGGGILIGLGLFTAFAGPRVTR